MNLFTFKPGDLILSSQINYNFDQIRSVLGQDSTKEELSLPGRLVIGPSQKGSISSLSDATANSVKYLHIGWNAEESIVGNNVTLQKVDAVSGSSAIQLGQNQISLLLSQTASSSPIRVFGLNDGNRIFIHQDYSFVEKPEGTLEISDYRLMFNPVGTALATYSNSGTTDALNATKDISSVVGSRKYHGVEVSITATAKTSPVEIAVFGQNLDKYTGVVFNLESSQKATERGCVVFARGSAMSSTIAISASAPVASLSVSIVGFWK